MQQKTEKFGFSGLAMLGVLVFIITIMLLALAVIDFKLPKETHANYLILGYNLFLYVHFIIFPSFFLFVKNPHILKTSLNVIFG